jgi:hypothetical protein
MAGSRGPDHILRAGSEPPATAIADPTGRDEPDVDEVVPSVPGATVAGDAGASTR